MRIINPQRCQGYGSAVSGSRAGRELAPHSLSEWKVSTTTATTGARWKTRSSWARGNASVAKGTLPHPHDCTISWIFCLFSVESIQWVLCEANTWVFPCALALTKQCQPKHLFPDHPDCRHPREKVFSQQAYEGCLGIYFCRLSNDHSGFIIKVFKGTIILISQPGASGCRCQQLPPDTCSPELSPQQGLEKSVADVDAVSAATSAELWTGLLCGSGRWWVVWTA